MNFSNVRLVVLLLGLFLWTSATMAHRSSDTGARLADGVAKTALVIFDDSGPGRTLWNYEKGVMLVGLQRLWEKTHDDRYFQFVQRKIDELVLENGTMVGYNFSLYTLDNILPGRNLLFLWKATGLEKYRKAADVLRSQLASQPRTNEGGFWHKDVYPYQMWADGLYMAEPFYAEYALTFGEPSAFDDIAKQFILAEEHLRDPKTGLLYHGYDESRAQNWSDPTTGQSPSFWARADGWLFMGLVDTLDYFPLDHPKRGDLLAILERLTVAIATFQDHDTGVWWEVLDKAGKEGNYLESSSSAMFVYCIAKAVRLGYVPDRYHKVAKEGYRGIERQFIRPGPDGGLNLTRTVSVGGLGGNPYRNGTFEYYISEAVVTNDSKGMGPFIKASVEIDR